MSERAKQIKTLPAERLLALVERLKAKQRAAGSGEIPRLPRPLPAVRLSFAQERLWFLDRLAPRSVAYNVPTGVRLQGKLAIPVLAASLAEIVRRHEALRTRFAVGPAGPLQVVEDPAPLPLPFVDLRSLPAGRREAELAALAAAEAATPFDLELGPMLRVTLLATTETMEPGRDDDHALLLTMHHIVADGWSIGVLIGELTRLYAAFLAGQPSPLPELPVQYSDFAAWQRDRLAGEALERELQHWREALAGAPTSIELATDRPRPPLLTTPGKFRRFVLPPRTALGVRELARRREATLFMVGFAGFAALIHRMTGQDSLLIGSAVASRQRAELEGLIGFFVNTVVLRSDLADGESFDDLLTRTRERALAAFAHQDLPFERLVEAIVPVRDPSRPPLVQIVFQVHNTSPGLSQMPGLSISQLGTGVESAKFDLVMDLSDGGERIGGKCLYNTDLFDATTIERLIGSFVRLLGAATAAPEAKLAELPLLSPAERHQLDVEWGGQAASFDLGEPERPNLHAAFTARAAASPDATAVLCGDERLSYGELEVRSNRLAHHLLARGLAPGRLVGLCLERSLDLPVAILAVLKAGCAYVPIDPAYPPERLALLLADSGVAVLVTRSGLVARLDGLRAEEAAASRTILRLDADEEAIARASGAPPGVSSAPRDLAYAIYTSGSTGRPKGALVEHAQVLRLFAATEEWLQPGANDVWTLFHSYAFDFAVWELWGALLYGGRLVMVPHAVSRSPVELYSLLLREEVTILSQTPSAFRQLIWAEESAAGGGRGLAALRWVVFGGEALEPAALAPWMARHGDERPGLANLYGITETTVHTTLRRVRRSDLRSATSPIGRPLPDLSIHLLDRDLTAMPIGAPGEIFVGGAGVARGYLGRPELTAERFVPDPFADEPGARLYRSGDLARWVARGELVYLGRIDRQVKVRGFRVELGEIQAALGDHPAVREAVVMARRGPDETPQTGEPHLVAFVAAGEPAPEAAELRGFLAARLPEHMLPAAYVVLPELPLTAHGKVDRRALEAIGDEGAEARAGSRYVAPRDALETFLADLFVESLKVERVGIHDSFFALGGNSIAGAILVNRLQQALGEIVQVVVIFEAPSVDEFAAHLRREHPRAVARIWGEAAARVGEGDPVGPVQAVDAARLAGFRRWVKRLPPRAPRAPHAVAEPRNPRAVFVLAPPRSGTTLLRVMLGGHPRLFAPPELELLSFHTLAERREAFSAAGGRDSFWLEGAVRAVMAARGCGAEEARATVAAGEREGWSTQELYRRLQSWIGDRLLVDKTPSYALDPAVLARAEEAFDEPLYLHLLRHPYGMIRSFEEAKLDQLLVPILHPAEAPGRAGVSSPWSRRELAELIWLASQQNILEFLSGVPASRQRRVVFEDLVARPEEVLAEVCGFLGLPYEPAMADPYREPAIRMTDGLHAASRMLGDVKFHQHRGVERRAADRWRSELAEDFLGEVTWQVAIELGYRSERRELRAKLAHIPALEHTPGQPLPLSFAQERLWLLDRLEPGSPAYNIPLAVELSGNLAVAALAASLAEVVRRHAVLRTTFVLAANAANTAGEPRQVIAPVLDLALPCVDLSGLSPAARDEEGRRLAGSLARRPFDLARGPLVRAALLRLEAGRHAALFVLHHIVADGWSMGVLAREVGALYAAAVAGAPSPLPELAIQYADFALWQRGWLAGTELDRQLGFWRERLAGAPAALALSTDRPRPAAQRHRGASVHFALPPAVAASLRKIALARSATLYMTLLTGFAALLSRLAGQRDLVVGSVIANRNRADLEGLIGFFVNALALRIGLDEETSFTALLARVRESALGAYAHQDLPFELLVDELHLPRDASRSPLFQVVFQMQNVPPPRLALPGLALRQVGMAAETSKFDLETNVVERGRDLGGVLTYDVDLFDRTTAARLLTSFAELLAAAVADPERPLADLPLLGAGERHQMVVEWNDTAAAGEAEDVMARFASHARRQPGAPAIEVGARVVGYGELAAWAGRLALRLRSLGVGPESRVAVLAERAPSTIAGYLAVLAAGGCYVALDPLQPAERLAAMAEDAWRGSPSQPPVLLGRPPLTAGFADRLAARGAVLVDPADSGLQPDGMTSAESVTPADIAFAPRPVPAEAAAYVVYTSGSTGLPKGVVVSRGALANLVAWHLATYEMSRDDRATLLAGTGFDASVWEIWSCLAAGATLVVADEETRVAPAALVAWLASRRITLSFLPTPLAEAVLAEPWPAGTSLRALLAGGDRLHEGPPAGLPFRLVNHYGPTESAVVSTMGEAAPGAALPSIGRPIGNLRVRLLAAGQPVPMGVAAELAIGGTGLARGYLGDAARTAERFVPDPLATSPGERLYRTGDLARFLSDGRLEFLGRGDGQVKIRGVRIELGEIEATLAAHPAVAAAAVTVRGSRQEAWLAAYVVPAAGGLDAGELRRWLKARLPSTMIPAAFVELAALPTTANGKLDRGALPEPDESALASAEHVAPRNAMEELLASIWIDLLRHPRVGAGDSFFDLGGNSLQAIRLMGRVQEELGVELEVRAIFEAQTLGEFSVRVAAEMVRSLSA